MARIQVLELPREIVGEYADTPFVLVIDCAEGSSFVLGDSGAAATALEAMRVGTGARSVIVCPDKLEVV